MICQTEPWQWVVSNPTLVTPDHGFFSSAKAVVVDVTMDQLAESGCAVLVGQCHVTAAGSGPSFQGARGNILVDAPVEGTGLLGYAVFTHPLATGAGVWGIVKAEVEQGPGGSFDALRAASEGSAHGTAGLRVFHTTPDNEYWYGVMALSGLEGAVLMANSRALKAQNAAGASNVEIAQVDSGDRVVLSGQNSQGIFLGGYCELENPVHIKVGGRVNLPISVGPPDSGGPGYRLVRVPN